MSFQAYLDKAYPRSRARSTSSGSHRDASILLRLDGVAARTPRAESGVPPRPYPPDIYLDDDGEASAWLRRTDESPEITYRDGGTCEYLATGDQTAGRFGLYRWTFGETESGPDPHFHRSISEQFYVLSGEVRLYDGRQWVTARSGDFLYVPEGGIHGFRGAGRASMLLMFAPGGPREDYFETRARGEQMTEEQRAAFMQRHDTYWV